jgi:hypothetical protein
MSKAKESQTMLRWMKLNSNKLKWAKWVGLEGLFNLQWTMPREDMFHSVDLVTSWINLLNQMLEEGSS